MNHFVVRFFLGFVAPLLRVSAPIFDQTEYHSKSTPTPARQPSVNGRPTAESDDTHLHLITSATDPPEIPSLDKTCFVPASNGVQHAPRVGRSRYSTLTSRPLMTSPASSVPTPADPCSRLLARNFSVLAENVKQKRDIRLDQERWRFLARVLDRMFFILFLLTICTSTILIYFKVE